VLEAVKAFMRAEQDAQLDDRGGLGFFIARLAWGVVFGTMSPLDAVKSARISLAWRNEVGADSHAEWNESLAEQEGDVRRAVRKGRADTSDLVRAQRVYYALAHGFSVLPRPDTHEPPRGRLASLLRATRFHVIVDIRTRLVWLLRRRLDDARRHEVKSDREP
jgi:hypothetical protein